MMFNKNDLIALANNDGMTLKRYRSIKFKTGYQVTDYGVVCHSIDEAFDAIVSFNGNCGVWFSEGIYYVDHSFRVKTLKKALTIGKENGQQAVLRWRDMALVWC